MGTCYLCSRSELFRLLFIEADSSILFISPPVGFIDWFRRAIPTDHTVLRDLSTIPERREFDHIVLWTDGMDDMREEDTEKLIGSYSGKGGVWIGLPVGEGPDMENDEVVQHGFIFREPPLNLSTEYDIFRAWTIKDDP